MTRSSVELRIEELVLHGFASTDRYRIAEAVAGELTRLFAERGLPPWMDQGGEVAYLSGGTFEVRQAARADEIGTQAAQSLYRGLAR